MNVFKIGIPIALVALLSSCYTKPVDTTNTGTNTGTGTTNVKYKLTVSKTGNGTVSGSGIDCGADCEESIDSGGSAVLTATPDAGSSFTGWGGVCNGITDCSVTMGSDKTVYATFVVNVAPPAGSDTIKPALTISSLNNNQTVANSSLAVSGTASDNIGVTSVHYTLNGAARQTAIGTANWNFTVTLAVGSNAIQVFAKDAAGNEITESRTVTFDPGTFSLTPTYPQNSGGKYLVAQNADALYAIKIVRAGGYATLAQNSESITMTGSVIGTGSNQIRAVLKKTSQALTIFRSC